jgi:ribosomal-protein-alanine N-acetyltransferase
VPAASCFFTVTVLRTARLTLRPQLLADAPALFVILNDAEAMRFWNHPPIRHLAVVEGLLREQQDAMDRGVCRYWTLEEDKQVIGSLDLSLIENASAELGFLLRRDRWGLGLASEAVAAVIAHGFGPLGLMQLAAAVQTGNGAAVRILEKNGFVLVETHAAMPLTGGRRADCAFFVRDR